MKLWHPYFILKHLTWILNWIERSSYVRLNEISCLFLPFWSRPTKRTLFVSLFGIIFLKWQNGHIFVYIERLVQSAWYLFLQWMHRRDISLVGSIRETCFPQKHMTWSLRLATVPPSVTTLLVETGVFGAKVNVGILISFNEDTLLMLLACPEVFELVDRLS